MEIAPAPARINSRILQSSIFPFGDRSSDTRRFRRGEQGLRIRENSRRRIFRHVQPGVMITGGNNIVIVNDRDVLLVDSD